MASATAATTTGARKPGTPSVLVRLATLSDIPRIARCWYEAFFDDVVIGEIMHPHRKEHPEDVYYFLLRGIRERYFDWTHQFVVATVRNEDGAEKVIGAVDWRRLGEGGRKRQLWRADPRNLISPSLSLYHRLSLTLYPNRAADPATASLLSNSVDFVSRYYVGDRAECWDLYVCGVDPGWQGKGIGKMLVSWGTSVADEEKVACSVITGESKRGFYGKSGFEKVGPAGEGDGGIVLFRDARK